MHRHAWLHLLVFLACAAGCPRPSTSTPEDAGQPDAATLPTDGGNTVPADAGITDAAVATDAAAPPDAAWPAWPRCTVGTPPDALTIATTQGLVKGAVDGDTVAFKGMPYAAPPFGNLRFRPPVPPDCWTDVRDGTDYRSRCVQRIPGSSSYQGDEDCLFLNVWRPSRADAGTPSGLPVMFFIHGGANIMGSANENGGTIYNLYDGVSLASSRNVVVVTINYRLGPLGFLAHPALTVEDPHHSSGNYALLDIMAALRWVQANIATFGGDPAQVMVFGESAGALDTCMLLASPLARGLFHAALMESGECAAPALAERESVGQQLATNLGCTADVAACLRRKTPNQLTSLTPVSMDMMDVWDLPFGPNVDGYVLPRAPLETIRRGEHNRVPFIVGTNAHETELFLPAVVNTCADYLVLMQTLFPTFSTSVVQQYPCLNYTFPRWAAVDATTDMMFTCPARRIARAVKGAQTEPVRRYHYRHIRPYGPLTAERAFHASELPYVFGTYALGYVPLASDDNVSHAMQAYWSAFAAAGDPNGASAPLAWPVYGPTADRVLVLADPVTTQDGVAGAHCDFWDTLAH